ncbi:MAG: hypothetical protein LBF70_01345 [Holosporales bacterium]|jgi:DNA polymerase-3 subunit delta'|nr:hypothetical protein [Holosporales bacterium]
MIAGKGIIIHGSNNKKNIELAYETAIAFMNNRSSMNNCSSEDIKKCVHSNIYPNFFLIDKETEANDISVERTREAIEFLSKKPTLNGNIAVIIKDSESMSRNAANSILKILEEMPDNSIMILVTCKLLSIIPTIRSRCEKIRVRNQRPIPSAFSTPEEYIQAVLPETPQNIQEQIISFLESKSGKIEAFDKELFFTIATLYHAYNCHKTHSLTSAKAILNLQNLFHLSQNTYPDDLSLINAGKILFSEV